VRQTLRRTLVDILQVAVVLDDARIYPEEVDASGERIGRGLEYVGACQIAFDDRPMRFGAVDERRDIAALHRTRHIARGVERAVLFSAPPPLQDCLCQPL